MKKHTSLLILSFVLLIIGSIFSIVRAVKKYNKYTPEVDSVVAKLKYAVAVKRAENQAVEDYAASLSDEVRMSQLFLVNIEGNEKFHSVEKTGVLYGKSREGMPLVPGGVLLFSYNVSKDPLETYEFIKTIRDFYLENQNVPPYVAVDQEGGDVNRLRGLTSTLLGQKNIADSLTPERAEQLYSAQARQIRNLGFHLNLAPVVEVENDSNRDFLDTRTFGNLEKVLLYGRIAVESYEKNGIGVVLKHFPGNSSVDPHVGLPKITFEESELANYIKPFEQLLSESSGVLMSHAIMKPVSGEHIEEFEMPACFSHHWVTDVARTQCMFQGIVISDDIFMGALAKNGYPPEEAAVKAINAGVDVIMLSEKRFGHVAKILLEKAETDENFAKEIDRAVKNVIRYKIKAGILLMEEVEEIPKEISESTEENKNNKRKSAGSVKEAEMTVPAFSVRINPNYEDFDLKKFDEDYKSGMAAYN